MKILCAISEVDELTKTGGLADVGKSLPLAMLELGHNVRVVTPYYRHLKQANIGKSIKTVTFVEQGVQYEFDVIEILLHQKLVVYGIDCPIYFDRDGIYANAYQAYQDNAQRFAFFSLACLYLAQLLEFQPDVLHCHDWHTALGCFFIKHHSSDFFAHTKSVLTIHNGAFQGITDKHSSQILANYPALAHAENINMLELGILHADKITAVSPNYAQELVTHLGSHGLFNVFDLRRQDVHGILNGCDYQDWSPATDTYIAANYHVDDLSGKEKCKRALQKHFGLPIKKKVPIIGMVCRLTDQKGFNYLLPALDELLQHEVQLIIVGTGDPNICASLVQLSQTYAHNFAFYEGFSHELAHQVEAGSDFFLMPSLFEPCGLNQMYSLAYGTLPIVRAVGGLKDTVTDMRDSPNNPTGFVFDSPTKDDLLHCVRRALLCYQESPEKFKFIQRNGMLTQFSWLDSANQYLALFQQI